MTRIVERDSAMAEPTSRGSPPTSVMSDASIATSAPVPMATPRSARASAGASLMPSPTIATLWPSACRRSMTASLSPGRTSAMTFSAGDPDLARDGLGGGAGVAREQPHDHAGGPEVADRLGGLGLDRVRDGDETRRRAVDRDEHHGPAVRGDGSRGLDAAPRGRCPAPRAAGGCRRGPRRRRSTPRTPRPTIASNPSTFAKPSSASRALRTIASPSGCSEPVSRAAARSRTRASSKPVAGITVVTAGRPSVSVPVLSMTTVSMPPGGLERLAAPDEDARLGALARPDHDRGRRGEAHRARAGDDHDADEGREREGEPRLRPEDEPDDEGRRGDQEHGRDEDLADPVGHALDRGLGALGALDELDDPSQGRVAPDARRTHHERARRVDGGADDLVAGALRGGDRLAGEHRLVDRGHALDHDAVDRHLVAGTDAQQVAGDDERELDVLLEVAANAAGGRRLQADEAADRPGRAALGAGLEPLPEQDQAQDDRRRVEVGLGVQPGRVDDLRPQGHEHGVAPGGARADRHQGVHRGPAVPARAPGGPVEAAARPELDERRGDQDQLVDVHHRHRRSGA